LIDCNVISKNLFQNIHFEGDIVTAMENDINTHDVDEFCLKEKKKKRKKKALTKTVHNWHTIGRKTGVHEACVALRQWKSFYNYNMNQRLF
jgi:hypothetical protein